MLAWLTFLFTKTIKIRSRKSGSVSNSAEIFAVLRTAYRVFFENSQIFGAACWNRRKFVPAGLGMRRNWRKFLRAVWECTGTSGNSSAQFGNILEPSEICSRSLAACWNWRKFVPAGLEYAGTSGNLSAQFGNTPKPAEIVAVLRTAYRFFFENSQGLFGKAQKLAVFIRFTNNRRVSVAGNNT